jgi:hypothetical protein
MAIPRATAEDLVKGRAESDAQDFNDELIPIEPYRESGAHPAELAEDESMDRAAEDLLVGLRQLQGGEEIRWQVNRVGEMDDTRNGFLIECATSNLTQTWLRDNFGGGTYRIRGHYPNGKYAAQRTIRVAGDAPRKNQLNGSAPTSNPGFDVQAFIAQQDARDRARQREIQEQRRLDEEREEKRRKERLDMIAALAPLFAPAIANLVGNKGPDVTALVAALKPPDPLTMLTQLKALNGSGNQDITAKILPLILDKALSGSSGAGDTGWLDVVKELAKSAGPTVGALIENSVQQARANAQAASHPGMEVTVQPVSPAPPPTPPVIVVPESPRRRQSATRFASETQPAGPTVSNATAGTAAAPTVAVPSNGTTPAGGSDMLGLLALAPHLPWLREQLARMGVAAIKKRDPELYAQLFLEELPESIPARTVLELLTAADWYGKLCQIEPRLNREDLVPWFTSARDILIKIVSQAPELAGGQSTTPSGSAPPITPAPAPAGGNLKTVVRGAGEVQRPTKLPSLTGE